MALYTKIIICEYKCVLEVVIITTFIAYTVQLFKHHSSRTRNTVLHQESDYPHHTCTLHVSKLAREHRGK